MDRHLAHFWTDQCLSVARDNRKQKENHVSRKPTWGKCKHWKIYQDISSINVESQCILVWINPTWWITRNFITHGRLHSSRAVVSKLRPDEGVPTGLGVRIAVGSDHEGLSNQNGQIMCSPHRRQLLVTGCHRYAMGSFRICSDYPLVN